MIYVTVGTDNHDFSRLIEAMDELNTKEKVVIQLGNTTYRPKNKEWFTFESNERIEELYIKSDVIITHAGAGSIIRSLKNGKVPIVVPRLKKYGEHINNHQMDIASALAKRGKIVVVENVGDLEKEIKKRKRDFVEDHSLVKKIKKYLEAHEKEIS